MPDFRRLLSPGVFAAALLAGANAHAAPAPAPTALPAFLESRLPGGRFGVVHVYRPVTEPTNVALLFSGDGGWEDGVVEMAQRLAQEGYLVGGVDTTVYIASIAPKEPKPGELAKPAPCTYVPGDVEALSQHLQWAQKLPAYLRPVLFGYSAGASVVYTTLAQSHPGAFAGGVSLSFCAEMEISGAHLCPGAGLKYKPIAKSSEVTLQPDPKLAFPWTVVHGDRDTVCRATQTKTFMRAIPGAKLVSLPKATHDLTPLDTWWPRVRQDYRAMVVADTAVVAPLTVPTSTPTAAPIAVSADSLHDLPLTEVAATGAESDVFAVFMTGDGGWADLDQNVSAQLAAHGIPIVALNSLKYFWTPRNAESTANDVNRIIEQYSARWRKARVMLIGYSFGADVMPFVFNRLPESTRSRVASVSLMGLGPAATYEVTVGEWLPGADAKGDPVVPEVARMPALPRLCIVGAGEDDSSCPAIEKFGVTVRQVGKGHHFSGDFGAIAEAILGITPPRS